MPQRAAIGDRLELTEFAQRFPGDRGEPRTLELHPAGPDLGMAQSGKRDGPSMLRPIEQPRSLKITKAMLDDVKTASLGCRTAQLRTR